MTTDELLDTLDEAARYVRSDPTEAARLATAAVRELELGQGFPRFVEMRLAGNLVLGVHFLQVEQRRREKWAEARAESA